MKQIEFILLQRVRLIMRGLLGNSILKDLPIFRLKFIFQVNLAITCHCYQQNHCLSLFRKVVKQLIAVLCLFKLKSLVIKALTITNVPGSTLSREADYTLLLHAGPEIAVASTKAYTAQLAVLAIFAEVTARSNGMN